MAEYTQNNEPVVIKEREIVHDDNQAREPVRNNSSTPYILLALLALIILGYLFFRYNPFATSRSTTINTSVPVPTLQRH